MQENEICETCKGEGEIEKNIHRGVEGMQIEMDVMVTCPDCEGTGFQRLPSTPKQFNQ